MTDGIWLGSYPAGVPATIDPDRFASLPDMLARAVERFPRHRAFHNLGHTMSYAEVGRRSRDFAAFLQQLPGMRKGERVAIMAPNLLQYPVALFGILRAGLVVVNVNPMYTARELQHQLKDAGARAIVIVENFAATLQQVLAETDVQHVITTQVGDLLPAPRRWLVNVAVKRVKKMVPAWRIPQAVGLRAALARGAACELQPVAIDREDVALLQYTGGTTGVAKGAMLTHRNVLANMEQTSAWLSPCFEEGREIAIAPLPLYHIFSLTATLSFMAWGSLSVLVTNPRDLPALVKELGRWKWTIMTGVNTLFNGLLNTPGFAELDFSSLKAVIGGGAAVQGPVAERWQRVTGCTITEGYGLTEASPVACANPIGTPWNGTIGIPYPSTQLTVRNERFEALAPWDGTGEPAGHVGEICVSGPQVMKGYWNNAAETAAVLKDGWLRTGDIGYMDARGWFTITDRKKDMILVSGFNVYPNEVESVIATLPGILECGVVGVPDAKSGEAVKAVIVRTDPGITQEAVIAHCRAHLAGYKVPRSVEFRDALPKSPIGKILRRELRTPVQG
ncbi:MAG TPA: AMP-binding protein [Casimicrobiaceae bacterium]|nr:AMP-binding protein [Casimicrobiaceae bacterium]